MSYKHYYVCTKGTPTEPEDTEVPGISVVTVNISKAPTDGEIAGAVLDEYHDSIAIAMLDDFEIDVLSEDGTVLYQSEDYEERSLQEIADFEGMIEISSAPAPVAAFMK
jgi:hypothetical protein